MARSRSSKIATQRKRALAELTRAERRIRDAWRRLGEYLRPGARDALAEAIVSGDEDAAMQVITRAGIPRRVGATLLAALAPVVQAATAVVDGELGIMAVRDRRPIDWLREHAATRVRYIDESVRAGIRAIVTYAAAHGESASALRDQLVRLLPLLPQHIDTIARMRADGASESEIRDAISRYAHYRALMVARTEVHIGYETARRMEAERASRALRVRIVATWETADDEVVCPICGPLDGETIDAGGVFSHGEPSPPAHPNCRCTIVYTQASA